MGADASSAVESDASEATGLADARRRPAAGNASTGAARSAPLTPPVGPPTMARLLEIADEVSEDGRYVRIGDVEISASPVVTRGS